MNKEELKDEMKNRISLALKDPILQQGFEIICKENAELEKENEALKGQMSLHEGLLWNDLQKLEKENAELKNLMRSEHEIEARKNNRLISQLTKAKELLRKLIDYPRIYGQASGRYKHECDLAEQFLKDSEVEK